MNELTPIDHEVFRDRPEYQGVTLEELEIMTDMADELLMMNSQMTDVDDSLSGISSKHVRVIKIARTFGYLESGLASGLTWPPTMTKVTITYNKTANHPTTEMYQFGVERAVQRRGLSNPNVLTVYTVEFFGKNRESAQTTIDTHDITSDNPSTLESRPMTSYDNEKLFDELGYLWNIHHFEEQEASLLKKIN